MARVLGLRMTTGRWGTRARVMAVNARSTGDGRLQDRAPAIAYQLFEGAPQTGRARAAMVAQFAVMVPARKELSAR